MRIRRFAKVIAPAALVSMALLAAVVGAVDAHTPNVTLACNNGQPTLTINLSKYNSGVTNTVAASIDSVSVLATTTFGSTYNKTIAVSYTHLRAHETVLDL